MITALQFADAAGADRQQDSLVMSITFVGRSISIFIKSIRLVPPATDFRVWMASDLAHRVHNIMGAHSES
jgi:hypothetical protein